MAVGCEKSPTTVKHVPVALCPVSPTLSPCNGFTDLISKLRHHLGDDCGLLDVDVKELMAGMSSYTSAVSDWERYALFDNSRYTRNLVDDGNGKYNLLIVCWGPGQKR